MNAVLQAAGSGREIQHLLIINIALKECVNQPGTERIACTDTINNRLNVVLG